MKILFVLAILALMGLASAETINIGNYSISFNYSKPYEIAHYPTSNTAVTMKTLDGPIMISVDARADGLIKDNDSIKYQWINISGMGGKAQLFSEEDVFMVFIPTWPGVIFGKMPIFDLANFLKTLKIERKAT